VSGRQLAARATARYKRSDGKQGSGRLERVVDLLMLASRF
jgi:hypothetical protein